MQIAIDDPRDHLAHPLQRRRNDTHHEHAEQEGQYQSATQRSQDHRARLLEDRVARCGIRIAALNIQVDELQDVVLDDIEHVESLSLEQVSRSGRVLRSEEHTSELQSLMRISYAVFCLKTKTPATN